MADLVDEANDLAEARVQDEIDRNKARIRDLPVGEPGVCCNCDWASPRLVNGWCAPCRDA